MNKTTALRDLPNVTGIIKGNGTSGFSAATSGTDYQGPIALTTIGTSGTAGWDGTTLNIPNYANNVGSSGTSGQSGATGSSGSSGSSGQTGGVGSSGSSGSTGTSGSSGQSGAAGSSGSSGQTGAAGSSGSSGQSGAAGSSGSSGSSGQSGAAGSSGSSGQTGGTGSSGSSGSSGQTGAAGSSGTSGTSPSAAAYVAKAGDTMTGNLSLAGYANPHITVTSVGGSYSYLELTDGTTSTGYIIKNTSSATSNGVLAGALYLYTDNSKPTQIVHSGSSNAAFLSGGDVYIRGQVYVGGNGASTGTQVVYNSGTWSISISGNATTATNLSGAGGSYIQSTSTGTSYTVNYQVRENSGGGSNTSEIYAPQLGFHWSGVVASSIMMEASGRIAIRNNPGSAYESFIASDITASSNLTARSNTTSGTAAGVVNLGGSSNDPSGLGNSGIIGLTWGLRGDSQPYYMVRSNSMTYGGYTYNRLDLSWHTGIVIGAAPTYGGIRFWNNSTNVGSLIASIGDGDGNMRSTSDIIAYASDKRLKENIINIPNALDKIKQINGVYFAWKDKTKELGFNPSQKNDVGVIAQEIQAILPEVVTLAPFDYELGKSKSGENYLTVKYDKLAPLFIEAIKELNQKVEDQQKIINDLLRR